MISKYGYNFTNTVVDADRKRLTNQLWKLIPMRENNEDWRNQLVVVIEEITGLGQIFYTKIDFLVLLSKLEGLTSPVCEDFMVYRKTVFRCIELLTKVLKDNE